MVNESLVENFKSIDVIKMDRRMLFYIYTVQHTEI